MSRSSPSSPDAPSAPGEIGLVPSGTARWLFLRARDEAIPSGASQPRGRARGKEAEPDPIFPRERMARLRAAAISSATLWTAWEIARCAPAATLAERRALAMLTIALLVAMDAGHSHLRLSGGGLAALLPLKGDHDNDGNGNGNGDDGTGGWAEAEALLIAVVAGRCPSALAHLFGFGETTGARTPFVVGNGGLYAQRVWTLELRVLGALARRVDARSGLPAEQVERVLDDLQSSSGARRLTSEQREATRAALGRRLTIVTGGPGTGKTSTILALLRALVRLGVPVGDIALAAPTGRAAQRITEMVAAALPAAGTSGTAPMSPRSSSSVSASWASIDDQLAGQLGGATTLHRLLGFRGERLRALDLDVPTFYRDWKLPRRVIIVDEASMIDLPLMDALLAALDDEASLILCGDADQLPSVQMGAVFRDLVASVPGIVSRLTHSHRVDARDPGGAEILAAAGSINRGEGSAVRGGGWSSTARRVDTLTWRGVETLPGADLAPFLKRWYSDLLGGDSTLLGRSSRARFLLRHRGLAGPAAAGSAAEIQSLLHLHARARLLCLTRVSAGLRSAAAVNQAIHRFFVASATRGDAAPRHHSRAAEEGYRPGEPVLVLRNDEPRGLYNGDVGVVIRATEEAGSGPEQLYTAFSRPHLPGGLSFHPLDELKDQLTLAFAMTVHKAQGSEFEHVGLILPPQDIPLLTREILYTALTRARRGVVVVGDLALLEAGAARALGRASALRPQSAP